VRHNEAVYQIGATPEEPFGWMKTVGGLGKLRHRGEEKVRAVFTLTCAAFNLVRLRNLGAEPGPG